MNILIVGIGKIGEALTKDLLSRGHNIVVIEKDESIAQRIAEEYDKILVIAGDGCDPLRLEDAKIGRAQIVAAVTGDDEDNLIISQLAKEIYKVPRVIARVNNPRNEETFKALGIDGVSATTIITKLIEEEATVGDLVTLLTLKRGKISILGATLDVGSPASGKRIKDLSLPANCIIASVLRGGKAIFPRGETVFHPNDSVIALTTVEHEKELKKILLGK